MKKLIILFTFCYSLSFSQKIITEQEAKNIKIQEAQEPSKFQFLGKGKYYGDSIVLRWSANDAALWQLANVNGYTIERYELVNGNFINKKIIANKLKPWTLDEWKAKCKKEDTTAAVIAQILYGVSNDLQNPQGYSSIDGILNKRYDMDNRFFIANMLAAWHPFHAKGMALRIADNSIQKNKNYLYKIFSSIDKKIMNADTALLMLQTFKVEPLEKFPPIYIEPGDKVVKLKWSRILNELDFTGVYYERSDDNGKTYQRINRTPYLQLTNKEAESLDFITITDSLPKNYFKYFYRVTGINYFGELGSYSSPIEVIGKDLTPPSQVNEIKCENLEGTKVKITWKKKVSEQDFIGYVLGRSQNINGPFEPLQKQFLPRTTNEFIDETADPYGTNYYVVSAIDTAGNAAISLPAYVVMKDETPPATPTGLKGQIDSTGIVKITWNKNQEPDLLGYMVYTANAPDHVFTPITTGFLADEFFADSTTLLTLTKYKYYKVVAFDKSRHASPYSEILKLKRPDKIPPVAPVMSNFSVTDSSTTISWIPSSSEDAVKQLLYRNEEGKDTDWKEIKQFDSKQTSYTDTKLTPKHWYSYAIVAVDESGLKSEYSFPMRVRPYDSGIRKGIEKLKIEQIDSKNIKISWQFTTDPKARILIYRKKDNDVLVITENLPSSQNSFSDKITSSGKYQYAIKVIYDDGGKSILNYTDSIQIIF